MVSFDTNINFGCSKICYGNSLFSSPHQSVFNILVILSSKKWKDFFQTPLMFARSCLWGIIGTSKQKAKFDQKSFLHWGVWNPVCYHGNNIVQLILWNTASRALLQRIEHFFHILIRFHWELWEFYFCFCHFKIIGEAVQFMITFSIQMLLTAWYKSKAWDGGIWFQSNRIMVPIATISRCTFFIFWKTGYLEKA